MTDGSALQDWSAALTLTERLARLDASVEWDAALGQRRLDRWRRNPAFGADGLFEQRLTMAGISENAAMQVLAEPPLTGPPEPWMDELSDLLRTAPSCPESDFVILVWPLAHAAIEQLQATLQPLALGHLLGDFTAPLLARLSGMVRRTVILELHIAREAGTLSGETPEDRFRAYLQRLDTEAGRRAVLHEYPVLARQCWLASKHWFEAASEFGQRLVADQAEVQRTFGDSGPVLHVDLRGDSHKGGRQVVVVVFEGGLRVVYKPRSLALDGHFETLVAWFNQAWTLGLRVPRVLDRGAYGWVECVAAAACESTLEVSQFFQRQGAWMALFYALGATDLHAENSIAAGAHPVPIDLEAVLHPLMHEAAGAGANHLAAELLRDSVMGIGLLPPPRARRDSLDVSALGGAAGQLSPYAGPTVEAAGTDDVRITRVRHPIGPTWHQATVDGRPVEAAAWLDAVEAGFDTAYRSLLSRRAELLVQLDRFDDDAIRSIVRSTSRYTMLLVESWHPDVLRNGLVRDQYFDSLWLEAARSPWLIPCIASETRQLQAGDVPYFRTTPTSLDVTGGDDRVLGGVLARSGRQVAERRVQRLGEADLSLQIRLLRGALACMPGALARPGTAVAGATSALELAQAVGHRLLETAVQVDDTASWILLSYVGESTMAFEDGGYQFGVAGCDLYSGLPGIVLFLAYLDHLCPDVRYRTLAERALATLHARLESLDAVAWPTPAAFGGWCGVMYLWLHLAALWDRDDLLQRAVQALPWVDGLLQADAQLDVIGGAAGGIMVLTAMQRPEATAVAIRGAERLADAGRWADLKIRRGLSHGLAGLGLALSLLAPCDARWAAAARRALAEERTLLSNGAWTDIHGDENGPMAAWCHGGPGLAMARLQAFRTLSDEALLDDARQALEVTLGRSWPVNHSLCHGALGNLEALRLAADVLADDKWAAAWAQRSHDAVEDIRQHGWRTSLPGHFETAGLMTGLAGIGYGLLRLAAPDRVPCVLLLEGPKGDQP